MFEHIKCNGFNSYLQGNHNLPTFFKGGRKPVLLSCSREVLNTDFKDFCLSAVFQNNRVRCSP